MLIEQRCNICIEENCKGAYNCNCSTCQKKSICNRVLRPTIRITKKCTQSCSHCCFECSPENEEMMNVETAKNIHSFLVSNNIYTLNIMGGEFFCNPNWSEVIETLSKDMKFVRLVTNADWCGNEIGIKTVTDFLKLHSNIHLSISKDRWHTNEFVEKAEEICKKYEIPYNVATEEQTQDNSLVPVGRSECEYGLYSSFACYCQNPDNMYSFLIDEQGEIYKCSFGILNYSDVSKHLNGGFDKVFKNFNQKFYKAFVGNCMSCNRSFKKYSCKEKFYKK